MTNHSKKFYLNDEKAGDRFLLLEEQWSKAYALIPVDNDRPFSVSELFNLFARAVGYAADNLDGKLMYRLEETALSADTSSALQKLLFQKDGGRVEFRRELKELPDSSGSPFIWKSAQQLGYKPKDIAELLVRVAAGDPAQDSDENPEQAISDWLVNDNLTSGTGCIHVGFLEGKPVALIAAQVNPKTGWSRISYMGVAPEARGQGLGKWVHRKGFDEMRAQGGTLYHGGTSADNRAMLKLFQDHGCLVYKKMEEWSLKLPLPTKS